MATIQGVYIALFGRPADPVGLSYFKSVTKDGADLSGIGNLAGQKEYTDRFAGMNEAQIVNSIYKSLFGRDAELSGLTFFVNELLAGRKTINNIAINILDGAQGDDKKIIDTKIAAADLFTKSLDTTAEILAYNGNAAAASARTWLATVKDSVPAQSAVDTAIKALDTANTGSTGVTGNTLTLTDKADTITPTSAEGQRTTANDDTIRAVKAKDLDSTDVVDGGAGVDTLNATMDVAAGTVKPVLKNVEFVNLSYGTSVLTGAAAFDAGDSTGIQKLTIADVKTAAAALKFEVKSVDKATTVALKNFDADVANSLAVIGFKGVDGSSDDATISLEKVAGAQVATATVEVAGIEKLTINSTGGDKETNTAAIKAADAATIVITGDKELTLTNSGAEGADNAKLKTVDASAFTGKLTYTASKNGETIIGGSKVDTITLGAGKDTLVYNNANKSTFAAIETVKGFKVGDDKFDVKAFALGSSVTVGTAGDKLAGDVSEYFKTDKVKVFTETAYVAPVAAAGGNAAVPEVKGVYTLYIDANNDGNYNAGTDMTIKLTEVVGTIAKTDFIFA